MTVKSVIRRVPFNPSSLAHRAALAVFLETGKWDIHFEATGPNLPYRLMQETLQYYLKQVDKLEVNIL